MTAPRSRQRRYLRVMGSTTTLIVIAIGIGLAIAAVLGGIAYGIALALHHASSST
jgi:hypothetical protein